MLCYKIFSNDDRIAIYINMKIEFSILNIEYWAAGRTIYLLDTLGGIVNPANIADIIPAAKAAVIIRNAIEYLPHFINMLSSFLFSMAVFVSLHSD